MAEDQKEWAPEACEGCGAPLQKEDALLCVLCEAYQDASREVPHRFYEDIEAKQRDEDDDEEEDD